MVLSSCSLYRALLYLSPLDSVQPQAWVTAGRYGLLLQTVVLPGHSRQPCRSLRLPVLMAAWAQQITLQ